MTEDVLPAAGDAQWFVRWLDLAFIYGTIILIPYDLPLIHQACIPLAALGVLLALVRGDLRPFLSFVRGLPLSAILIMAFCIVALASLYANLDDILDSYFQGEAGWIRGTEQAALLFVTAVFPFYFAFCLRRHENWLGMVMRAAWLSLPIPIIVGVLQLANVMGVAGLSHLPYVGGAYDGGFWRLTSVARESSWFGSFACVVLPFLLISFARIQSRWQKLAAIATLGVILLFVVLGTSKSAYVALAAELGVGVLIVLAVRRPWRVFGKVLFGLLLFATGLFIIAMLWPSLFDALVAPFAAKAVIAYQLFEPLLLGNTKFVSIGTRFGMAAAGVAMGGEHPLAGVGLGQFGFHVYNYIPLWGINSETAGWLSNDSLGWPSTSNLYARLIAETGNLGLLFYLAFRLVLILAMGARVFRQNNPMWSRDLGLFCAMAALVGFDFHRDSFINLDMWAVLGMVLACMAEITTRREAEPVLAGRHYGRVFAIVAAVSFFLTLAAFLLRPVSYQASATLLPASGGITITAPDDEIAGDFGVQPNPDVQARFKEFRVFWASRTVAVRLLASEPILASRILGTDPPITPALLADYIARNIKVLMANNETTLTLQYRNQDAALASEFLVAVINETDRAIAKTSADMGIQARQLAQMVMSSQTDVATRRALLARAAAQELQSGFDVAGDHVSFDYVEHSVESQSVPSPQPVDATAFALCLALLAGTLAVFLSLLWPIALTRRNFGQAWREAALRSSA